jgi:hypothetical protein
MAIRLREAMQSGATLIDWYITKDSIILSREKEIKRVAPGKEE